MCDAVRADLPNMLPWWANKKKMDQQLKCVCLKEILNHKNTQSHNVQASVASM